MHALAARDHQPFAAAEQQFAALRDHLESEGARTMTHSELERELEAKGRELMRSLLQAHLDLRSPGETTEPVRDAQGNERKVERLHERSLATVFGKVEVARMGYGAEGAESLHPLDAELNLPEERYSHELRRRAAEEAAKGSYDEAVAVLARATGTPVPKRQVEELVARAAQDFDAFYTERSLERTQKAGPLLVLSFDGKGVVMRREDLRPATRKAAAQRQHKLSKRLSKGEKRNARRMASVAAVYTLQRFPRTPEEVAGTLAPIHAANSRPRPRPVAKRIWASLEKDPEQVIDEIFEEARKRDPRHRKTWVVLVDGAEHPLRLIRRQRRRRGELTIVLDLIHVVGYLWKAALVFCDEGTRELEDWVSERLLQVLRGRASHVAAGIRRSATLRGLDPQQREAADVCADYLLRHAPYLRYHEYLAAGLPIATGVIEGACRHLVKDRMDLTGARWSLAGAEAVLRLRALRSSGDFDDYWRFHEAQEHQRNHLARYADQRPPATRGSRSRPRKPRLRIVK